MQTLTIQTPAGAFTRQTKSPYTHAVVWSSPRAAASVAKLAAAGRAASGVDLRWVKDRGHGVTWHLSAASAHKAAAKGYTWDGAATLVGVFSVI